MDVLNQKQWLEKYKLCSNFFFDFFRNFRKIEYRFSNFSKNYFSKNGQPLVVSHREESIKCLTSHQFLSFALSFQKIATVMITIVYGSILRPSSNNWASYRRLKWQIAALFI
jgi:hypothetical protein